jgi:hypothetical protein
MIHSPDEFNRALPAGYDGVFAWDFLDSAFDRENTNITPMDLDAVVERRGRFLFYETKNVGQTVQTGQRITLQELLKYPKMSVLFVNGKTNQEMVGFMFAHGNDRWGFKSCDPIVAAQKLWDVSHAWFEAVRYGKHNTVELDELAVIGLRDLRAISPIPVAVPFVDDPSKLTAEEIKQYGIGSKVATEYHDINSKPLMQMKDVPKHGPNEVFPF